MNTFVYILRADGARPSVSNYFLVWVSCDPFKKDDIGLVVFFLISKKKKKENTFSFSSRHLCAVLLEKKFKKKVKNIE
jgi:hypothetical protein